MEILHVEYSEGSAATYYIDKDAYSRAHRVDDETVILHAWGGTYTFGSDGVTLSNGVDTIPVDDRITRWLVTSD